MKICRPLAILLLLVLVVPGWAQSATAPQKSEKPDDVVVVTTNLVQVDAVVTDKNGRQVTDLRADDFELLENGREREIKAFSYVPLNTREAVPEATPDAKVSRKLPPLNLHAERPEQVRRAMAILVDDFGLSAESIARLRGSLEKFVNEHTSPTDLIAVIRTSGGPGSMQQFTSNRSQLVATIKQLRWYPNGRAGMSAVESFSPSDADENGLYLQGYSSNKIPNLSSKEFFPGTLASLGFVIQGLTRFPGRKSIVLVSDNLPATSKQAQIGGVTQLLDKLINLANRASIVISTLDARGLPKAGLTADDSQYNLAANQINARTRDRRMKFTVEQDALAYLAQQTGGVFVHDDNDLNHGLRRIVDSEQGYYLIAYRPDDADENTEKSKERSYKVSVRLKRPELTIRTRSSFHRTVTIREPEAVDKTRDDFLREALASPFVREDLPLKMTALFTGASQIKVLLHVDSSRMELEKTLDGAYKGSFDLVAIAFDNNGKVAGEARRTPVLNVPAGGYQRFLRDGFVYAIPVSVKSPGMYQVRLALRDSKSGRLGSDSELVEVPEVGKTRLSVAGFIVQGSPGEVVSATVGHPASVPASSSNDIMNRGLEVRRFSPGDLLTYSYLIYGATPRTADADLLNQARVFRGEKEVLTGPLQAITRMKVANQEGIVAGGSLKLGHELPPGNYFMQITVVDKLAPPDKQSSDQWIDFEIVGPAHPQLPLK